MTFALRAGNAVIALFLVVSAMAVSAATPPDFDPHSTPSAPCGRGVPPPGHAPPELRAPPDGLTLTVRQDGNRLCYVANGNADAPVIRVRQGSDLTITLRNEITDPAAIDALAAPGTLKTPNEPVPETAGFYKVIPGMHHHATGRTNLHVHGFAVSPVSPQDDVLTVCTDPAVGPAICGHRAFTYHYHVPADMPAGLYWYHPHVHGEVQAQMLMGLSGAIVVEGPNDDARRAAGIDERVLIVRQTQDVDAGGSASAAMTAAPAAAPGPKSPSSPAPAATQIDTAHELLCTTNSGIDEISLNGTPVPIGDAPDSALAQFKIAEGRKQLWRILNAATDAFLNLVIVDEHGKPLPLEVVGRDGSPVTDDAGSPRPLSPTVEAQFVPPSGRLEILVGAPPRGVKAYLVTRAVDTGCAGDLLPERRLAEIEAAPGDAAPPAAAPEPPMIAQRDLFTGLMSRKTARERIIALAEYPRPGSDDETDFYIVERKPGAVLKPFEMGDPPAITVKAGTTEEWVIENWTHELHAFHIHQLHFRVLEVDGKPVADPPLLDVVSVPYATATGYHSKEGPVRPGRVRIKVTFPAALAGDIPFHCHLVDHEDNGMMAVLRVLAPSKPLRKAALPESPLDHPPICHPPGEIKVKAAENIRQSLLFGAPDFLLELLKSGPAHVMQALSRLGES
jgi:FtsP/CotA-like multicopper oxidase with cupredoxin domain